jgi:hypothetical protein
MKRIHIDGEVLGYIGFFLFLIILFFLIVQFVISVDRKVEYNRSRFIGNNGAYFFIEALENDLVKEADFDNNGIITDDEMEEAISNKFIEHNIVKFEDKLFINGEEVNYEKVGILLGLIEETSYE